MAGGLGLNQYLRDKMKNMAKEASPLTNIIGCEGFDVSVLALPSRAHRN
jgi:tRNA A37 threonylcarbamoyltransferase TsaD